MPEFTPADVWPNPDLHDVADYRSRQDRERLLRLYGTDSPVALVTGSAAPRVGNVVARHFLARGYRVAFHAKTSVERGKAMAAACSEVGLQSYLVTGDVSDESTVEGWIAEIYRRFGRLDVVVHCAASWERKPLVETKADDVRRNLDEHAVAAFLVAKHSGLAMAEQGSGGAVVLIGDWAVERPYPDFAAYFMGKGSIPTLTRAMAVELAAVNPRVRVNAILPGTVLLGEDAGEETTAQLREAALAKRIGTPEDIAAAAIFFAENSFITGVCLNVDGGRHCYAGPGVDAIAHPEATSAC